MGAGFPAIRARCSSLPSIRSEPREFGKHPVQNRMMLMTGRRVGLALAARKLLAACVWMSFIVPGWARPGESENLVVAVPVANMYSRASDDSDVVSQAIYGSDVKVLEEASGWAKVRTPDDYTGWMRLDVTLRGATGAPC